MNEKKKEEKKRLRDQEIQQRYNLNGYIPSPEDKRDFTPSDVMLTSVPLPEEYRTEGKVKIMNQKVVGSCVAHAIAAAMGYGEFKAGFKTYHDFSRGFIYANRTKSNYQGEGMITREAIKQVNHCGDCMYDTFPWNEQYPDVKARLEKNK